MNPKSVSYQNANPHLAQFDWKAVATVSLMVIVLTTTILFFAGCSKQSANPETEEEFWQGIDRFVTARMNPDGCGYGILVVQNGQIRFGKGWGMANIANALSFTADTPIELASLTKQFTAVAILILYEQDSLNLEMKIIDQFPDFHAYNLSWNLI